MWPWALLDHSFAASLWATTFGQSLLACVVIDTLVARWFTRAGARWFVLHSIVNLIIALFSVSDLCALVLDPIGALTDLRVTSAVPWMLNVALHTYHMVLFFRSLDWLDWLHHGLMTGVVTPLGFMFSCGKVLNGSHFFIMGVPGAVDYALLVLVKYGRVHPLTEKRINAALNVWLRSPGLVVCAFVCVSQGIISDDANEVRAARLISAALYVWNAQYFMQRVVGNLAVREDGEGSEEKKLTK